MSANVSDAGLANRPWRVDKADVQSKTLFMLLVSPTVWVTPQTPWRLCARNPLRNALHKSSLFVQLFGIGPNTSYWYRDNTTLYSPGPPDSAGNALCCSCHWRQQRGAECRLSCPCSPPLLRWPPTTSPPPGDLRQMTEGWKANTAGVF